MAKGKITQAEANYGRGDPIDHCGICKFYVTPGTGAAGRCTQVQGAISPYGISDVYSPLPNPFGKTLAPGEVQAIKAMAADAADRSQGGGGAPAPQQQPQQAPMQ